MPHKSIEDRKEYVKRYRESHPEYKEKAAKRNKLWREKNKEIIKEKRKVKYQENKETNRVLALQYYHSHKEEQSKKHLDRAHEAKIKAIKLKGEKCSVCGITYNGENASIFDFHHIDPNEKEFNPKRVINSGLTTKALEELDKCVLVCANCHRLIHNSKY